MRAVRLLAAALCLLGAPGPSLAAYVVPGVPQSAWTPYTPIVSAGSGTITAATASGAFIALGKTLCMRASVTITTNGTGANSVSVTLPGTFAASSIFALTGKETGNSFKPIYANTGVGSSTISLYNFDNTYPAASGSTLYVGGCFEVQ